MFFHYLNLVVFLAVTTSFTLVKSDEPANETKTNVRYIKDHMQHFPTWIQARSHHITYLSRRDGYIPIRVDKNFVNHRTPAEQEVDDIVEDLCTEECDWERDEETKKYILPYKFDKMFSRADERRLKAFMDKMGVYTNFEFVSIAEPTTMKLPNYYIYFYNGGSCRNRYGRAVKTGPQMMSIVGESCTDLGILHREFGHLFGLINEHQRYDRDKYLRIAYRDVVAVYRDHLSKYPFPDTRVGRILATYDYDLASITHCNTKEFSLEDERSILPLNERFIPALDQNKSLFSSCDWNKILTLYPGPVKPPPCVYNYRGYQYQYTDLCEYFYDSRTCHVACYFAGGRLKPYGLCRFATTRGAPPGPWHLKPDPYFSTDADVSSNGLEYSARLYIALYDKEFHLNHYN